MNKSQLNKAIDKEIERLDKKKRLSPLQRVDIIEKRFKDGEISLEELIKECDRIIKEIEI